MYIHLNPVTHMISKNFKTYPWSSYWAIENDISGIVKVKKVIELFDGVDNFKQSHKQNISFFTIKDFLLE